MKHTVVTLLALAFLATALRAQEATHKSDPEADSIRPTKADLAAAQKQEKAIPDAPHSGDIATDAGTVDQTNPEVAKEADGEAIDPETYNAHADLIQKKLKEFQTMQNFFCFMAIRKYVNEKKSDLQPMVKKGGSKGAQKLIASLFSACQADTMEEETMDKLISVKNREEADQLEFPFYKTFDLPKFVEGNNFELTAEDKGHLKTFDEVQKQFEKMAKDKKKGQDDEDDEEAVEEPKVTEGKRKRKLSSEISPWIKYPIFIAVIGMIVLLAMKAVKSTEEPTQRSRKKDDKEKKRRL